MFIWLDIRCQDENGIINVVTLPGDISRISLSICHLLDLASTQMCHFQSLVSFC